MLAERMLYKKKKKKKISVRYFEESATIGSWLTCQKDKGKRSGSK